jgi:hypothetical protein
VAKRPRSNKPSLKIGRFGGRSQFKWRRRATQDKTANTYVIEIASGHLSMRRPPAQNDPEQTPARARDGK